MTDERKKLLKTTAFLGGVLAAYYVFTQVTGLYIPCLFYKITGLKCPGCGISHMAVHLAHFQFAEAFHDNVLMFFMLPALLAMLVIKLVFMPKWLEPKSRVYNGIMICFLTAAIVFWVVRNLLHI